MRLPFFNRPPASQSASQKPAQDAGARGSIPRLARDRPMTGPHSAYSPARVETIIRGASTGRWRDAAELYELMIGTWDRLSSDMRKIRDAATSLNWDVQPWAPSGEDPSPEAQRRARMFSDAIWTMRPSAARDECDFEGLIEGLCDAFAAGIAVHEILWESRSGIIVPRATRRVPPRYLGWPGSDAEPDRLGLVATELGAPAATQIVDFPADQFIVGVIKSGPGHPACSATLRALGFWWSARNLSSEWLLNYAQLFGIPIRWATHSPDASLDTLGILDTFLADMGSSGWARFPEGTKLELKEAAKAGSDNPQRAIIEMADSICDKLLLGQTLTSDVSAQGGSRALGDVHERVEARVQIGLARKIAATLNAQLIPAFWRRNFGDELYPARFLPTPKKEEDPKATADWVRAVVEIVPVGKAWVYETLGVPMPAAGEETISIASPQPGAPDPLAALLGQGSGAPALQTAGARAGLPRVAGGTQLVDAMLEDLTGVRAQWLSGARPAFDRLARLALDGQVGDAEFRAALVSAQAAMPELFGRLDHAALAASLERAMGAAVVNGAIAGGLARPRRIL